MADIKQAAKWLGEGKAVRRPRWYLEASIVTEDNVCQKIMDPVAETHAWFLVGDLLATDWEVCE